MVLLHTQQTIMYLRVAPAAIWALDYCLTLEHEVHMFSSMGRWGIATVMFIVARYVPIAWIISDIYGTLMPGNTVLDNISDQWRSTSPNKYSSVSLVLILLATEVLSRGMIQWSLKVTAISAVTCSAITVPLLNSACVPTLTQSDLETATRLEHLIMGAFISTALFEFTVAAITIYHSMLLCSDDMYTLYTLASTLSKGSLLYALSLFAISVANIVSFSLPVSSGYSGIIDVFQGVLHGVIASRILFDLRDADRIKEDSFCLSDLQFAPHTGSTAT
ncbi:hypothetical protein EV702DRAFT_1268510 [Suillus placidus]|uniref:DUF6533 domain-containing protein n=1 Tax=Suillus placidus TaxID=48579 RepID=A0A9P6ZWT5_9AGAM|nr:hypothetical protein EV702DRAFT_1268510 [Suillus placidus]